MTDRAPLFRYAPPSVTTFGDIAAKVGADLGLTPDPEQQWLLNAIYAEKASGIPAARMVAAVAPRQNIKSSTYEVAAMTDLFVLEVPLGIWTAHQFKTSRKSFEDMRRRILANPEYDDRCKFRDSHGEEAITLHTGETLEFHARSGGSGRGFSCDRLTLDEGLYLRPTDMGSLGPTMVTRKDAQIRIGSSAGLAISQVLRDIRDRGRSGSDPSLAYVEYGAPFRECETSQCPHVVGTPGCVLDDRDLWWAGNSAMWVGRITEDAIADQRRLLTPAEFMREFLSWWEDPAEAGNAIDPVRWLLLADPKAERGKDVLFALDVAPDHSSANVAVAWLRPDGHRQVMLAAHHRGVDSIVARCAELTAEWGGKVLLEKTGTASFLRTDLETAGVPLEEVDRRFYVDGCASLDASITAGTSHHGNQAEMNAAVEVAQWASSGEAGARILARKDPRVSPLVAASNALHGLSLVVEYDVLSSVY